MQKISKSVESEKINSQSHLLEIIVTADELKKMARQLYGYNLGHEEMQKCFDFVTNHEQECPHISNAVKAVLNVALQVVIDPARCDWQKADPKDRELIKETLTKVKKHLEEQRFSRRSHDDNVKQNNK